MLDSFFTLDVFRVLIVFPDLFNETIMIAVLLNITGYSNPFYTSYYFAIWLLLNYADLIKSGFHCANVSFIYVETCNCNNVLF